ELSYYDRALSVAEITDLSNTNWFCSTSIKIAEADKKPEEGYCGDEIQQTELGEGCDNGKDNGKVCTASYKQSCVYCTDLTCQKVIVNEAGYCGDGIINGDEVCDMDPSSKTIFASATSTGTWLTPAPGKYVTGTIAYKVKKCEEEKNTKINLGTLANGVYTSWTDADFAKLFTNKNGTKTCINSCSELVTDCVECGLSSSGVKISGELINVLEPRTDDISTKWKSPLYYSEKPVGNDYNETEIRLVYGDKIQTTGNFSWGGYQVGGFYANKPTDFYSFVLKASPFQTEFKKSTDALVNSDPRCSDVNTAHYSLYFNADKNVGHSVPINVTSAQIPGQYDQILSPIIRKSNGGTYVDGTVTVNKPSHLRIVLSWRGNTSLDAGFLRSTSEPLLDNIYFSSNNNWATGINYYNKTDTNGIWYHGLSDAGAGLHVLAYTVDINKISSDYGFYVKSPEFPILSYFPNNVTVSVYIPEDEINIDDQSWRHFSGPAKVFNLGGAAASANTSAKYWHVFNVDKTSASNATLSNVVDNVGGLNSIRTDLKFSY
ncbi:MAG: hypothetical protein Q7S24_01795, partial [bacterium]|nr:hypothetical protein [bacterium]